MLLFNNAPFFFHLYSNHALQENLTLNVEMSLWATKRDLGEKIKVKLNRNSLGSQMAPGKSAIPTRCTDGFLMSPFSCLRQRKAVLSS